MVISFPMFIALVLLAAPVALFIAIYALAIVFGIIVGFFEFVLRVMKR